MLKKKNVALLTEGVDRNLRQRLPLPVAYVALLTEGVDRNAAACWRSCSSVGSPSSRRAWIEIVFGIFARF